jgi:hypothetical protein
MQAAGCQANDIQDIPTLSKWNCTNPYEPILAQRMCNIVAIALQLACPQCFTLKVSDSW